MGGKIEMLCWLSPVLFILHDMEEIVFGLAWKKTERIRKRYLKFRPIPFGKANSAEGFSACVYEKLLILCFVSLLSYGTGWYGLWFGVAAANLIHLIALHLIFVPLACHAYVPGFVTAILTVVPCSWMLWQAQQMVRLSLLELLFWCGIDVIIQHLF